MNAIAVVAIVLIFVFVFLAAYLIARSSPPAGNTTRRRDVKNAKAETYRAKAALAEIEALVNVNRQLMSGDVVGQSLIDSLTSVITEYRVIELKKELDK